MTDILLHIDGDLAIKNGDFFIGEATDQHQRLLLLAAKGEYKSNPTVGVDAFRQLDDEYKEDLYREIRREFVKDGMLVQSIRLFPEDVILINARYK